MGVGFEQLSYTCQEGEPENSCVICVALASATELEKGLEIPLISLTHSSTARGNFSIYTIIVNIIFARKKY